MALVNCPECGKEITDKTTRCIHCGYPLKTFNAKLPKKKSAVLFAAIALMAVVCVSIFFACTRLSEAEKTSVIQVVNAIEDIGDVQLNSGYKIDEAEKGYMALSKKCKWHVKNYDELLEARETYDNLKANEATELIDQIGEVNMNSQSSIEKAKKVYEALSENQKKLVRNADNLFAATEKITNLKIEDVNKKISAIGTVTLSSERKVTEARKAYDKLSESEKEKVTGYNTLVLAEENYENLTVENCESLIREIGIVSLNSKNKITKAKNAYNSLSKEAKEKVVNYSTLTKAEKKYKELEKEEEDRKNTLSPGDSFSTSKWQVTYKRTNISAKILPNSTSGYYMYYYAADDETFVDVIFQIKNIDTDILGIEELVGSCMVEYGGSTLTKNYSLFISSGSDIDEVYSWDGLDALNTTTLHVAITMPREVQTNGKSITIRLTIAGEEKIINVR